MKSDRFLLRRFHDFRQLRRSRRIHLTKDLASLLRAHILHNIGNQSKIVCHRIKDGSRLLRLHFGVSVSIIFNLIIVGNLFYYLFI